MGVQLINVTPTRDAAGKISWEMCVDNVCGSVGSFPAVTLKPKAKANTFVFAINDPANTQVRFSETPIYIGKSADGYPNGVVGPIDEITNVERSENDKTLVFIDHNKKKMDLTYQLNFVESDGTTAVTPLDPVIKNGGGSGGSLVSSTSILIGVALLTAIIASYAYGMLRERSATAKAAPGTSANPN